MEPDIQIAVNTTSMAGVLIACGFLIVAWRWFPFQFSLRSAFRAVYPIMFTGLLLFPFAQGAGLTLFASVAYTVFSIMVLVLMMQSAQIARDRGTNPVFAYAFFGACAYVPQALGFILGWITLDIDVMGIGKTAILSMLAAYALGMSLYFSAGTLLGPSKDRTPRRDDQIELTSGKVWKAPEEAMFSKSPIESEEGAADAPVGSLQHGGRQSDKKPSKTRRPIGNDGFVITDRLSKQCLVLKRDYGLSARETEVCELIARGRSVAAIAEELFVSENTVRTHSKHIYTKLDIHSRQELGELLSTVDPTL
ncbi:helix-turn-helix domain-containing protein [Slackia isoflavoniconvertens]|uniref:helix-turn-helix domain-containing protein n=1 Tax=Slackia isoflavoniconvertens TaxID=572010 RepID=UPI003F96D44A